MRLDDFIQNRDGSLRSLPFRITLMDGTVMARGKEVDPEKFRHRYSEQIKQAKKEGVIIGVNFQQPE